MRRISMFALAFSILFVPSVFAFPVQLIDNSYYYDIYSIAYSSDGEMTEGRLSGTSNQDSISKDFILAQGDLSSYVGGSITADPFSLSCISGGHAYSDAYELLGSGYAFVSSSTTFKPLETTTSINFDTYYYVPWAASYFILTDITEGTELFNGSVFLWLQDYISQYIGDSWKGSTTNVLQLDFDILDATLYDDHLYKLEIGALAQSGGDFSSAHLTADIQVVPVPEPSTLLLLSLALPVAWIRKNRFSKN